MATHAYVGIQNGKMLACTVDDGDKDNPKLIAKWMKEGATIERLPIDVVRENFMKEWPPKVEVTNG